MKPYIRHLSATARTVVLVASMATSASAAPPHSAMGRIVVTVDGPTVADVQLVGNHGAELTVHAPVALCGLQPGDYLAVSTAPGFARAQTRVTVRAGHSTALHLTMESVGSVSLHGATRATVRDITGHAVGPDDLRPGLYRVHTHGRDYWVPVRGGVVTRVDTSAEGILIGGQRLATPPGLRVTTWQTPGGRQLRGRRVRQERWYDKGPLTRIDELQWKIRTVVIHRARWSDVGQPWRRMHRSGLRSGRQFLIDREGTVHQLLDLFDHTFAGGPLNDATTVSIELGVPPGKTPSGPQLEATKMLLESLGALLHRVSAPFPSNTERTLHTARITRGLLTGRQAGYRSDARFPLNVESLSKAARGVPMQRDLRRERRLEGVTQATAVVAQEPSSTVEVRDANGTSSAHANPWIVCESAGAWSVAVRHPQRATVSRRVDSGVHRIAQVALGHLRIRGPSGLAATIDGPMGFQRQITLPWDEPRLATGDYRVSVPQFNRPPLRWAVRVDARGNSTLNIPDITDTSLPRVFIGGQPYPLPRDVRVVTHRDPSGMSFYRARRRRGKAFFSPRLLPDGSHVQSSSELGRVVRSVVLHADVVRDAKATFQVLVARGLSTHFAIDWDGTVYQFLDPQHTAFAASELNPHSIQIDLNNRLPNLVKYPTAHYVPAGHRSADRMVSKAYRRPISDRMFINCRDVKSYGYNAPQYRALHALLSVLSGVVEGISPRVPTGRFGRVPLRHLNWIEDFSGVIAHFHITPRRWDPGPGFDWLGLQAALAGKPVSSAAITGFHRLSPTSWTAGVERLWRPDGMTSPSLAHRISRDVPAPLGRRSIP